MAQVCRECKEPVSWNAAVCDRCGEENPLGRNPGDLAIMVMLGLSGTGLVTLLIWFLWVLLKSWIRHSV